MTNPNEPKARGRKRKTTSSEDIEVTNENTIPEVGDVLQANQELYEENERLLKEIEALKSGEKHYVAAPVGYDDALDHQVGQDGTAKFQGETLVRPAQSTLDDPNMIAKAEMLKFMEEPVTVEIAELSDENADMGFVIEVNGRKEVFRQGERKTVRRVFVEGLARAKKTGYRNQLVVDRSTGEQTYEYPAKTGLRYPFSVVHDPNPKGGAWLKAVLRQP
jgi:hypothetical protein